MSAALKEAVILGILVGGQATRMGGKPKGLLLRNGETLIERATTQFRAACDSTHKQNQIVLLGQAEPYAGTGISMLADKPAGSGPIGGVLALLEFAAQKNATAVLIGCDMPYLDAALFSHLLGYSPNSSAVAPRAGGAHWEPLFSRFDAQRALVVARKQAEQHRYGLQYLLSELKAAELPLTPEQSSQLRDWDSPADVEAD